MRSQILLNLNYLTDSQYELSKPLSKNEKTSYSVIINCRNDLTLNSDFNVILEDMIGCGEFGLEVKLLSPRQEIICDKPLDAKFCLWKLSNISNGFCVGSELSVTIQCLTEACKAKIYFGIIFPWEFPPAQPERDLFLLPFFSIFLSKNHWLAYYYPSNY